ncbi:hypothetical protein BGX38DRAFT_1223847 [Terfezia claveryi]|nr:hypothetical protein BGX38DRAFT_1223847 [Terfezia claveryi]
MRIRVFFSFGMSASCSCVIDIISSPCYPAIPLSGIAWEVVSFLPPKFMLGEHTCYDTRLSPSLACLFCQKRKKINFRRKLKNP